MIDILMATYNGGEYLENQLRSLLGQTYKDWRLLIHDDGSQDDTLSILENYAANDSRIFIVKDDVKFGNAGQNFLYLLQFVHANFCIFCDQDDIWFESKLEILLHRIKDVQGPCAIYCNAYGYDGVKITVDKVSYIERSSLEDSLFLNSGVQGCSLMFNRELLNISRDFPSFIYMHDHYITMLAVVFGKLLYVDLSLMLYRQHSSNVTGNVPTNVLDKLSNFFNVDNTILEERHYRANVSLFSHFQNKMNGRQKALFEAYINFPEKSLFGRVRSIVKHKFRVGRNSLVLIVKVFFKRAI